jgi:hypothetical protein
MAQYLCKPNCFLNRGLIEAPSPDFVKGESQRMDAKRMLRKDARLSRVDRVVVLETVMSKIDQVGKAGLSLGDIVSQYVETHLAEKSAAAERIETKRPQ